MISMLTITLVTAAATSIATSAVYERIITKLRQQPKSFDQHVHEMIEVLEPSTGRVR